MEWVISLHKGFVKSFKQGLKTIEVRTRIPKKLSPGDIIYAVQTGTAGMVALKMKVKNVLRLTPDVLFEMHYKEIQLNYLAFYDYFKNREFAYGIIMTDIQVLNGTMSCKELGILKAPQWFSLVK